MSDLDPPFPFDDEMVAEIEATNPGENGCTGCGCLGPTWATIVATMLIVLTFTLM